MIGIFALFLVAALVAPAYAVPVAGFKGVTGQGSPSKASVLEKLYAVGATLNSKPFPGTSASSQTGAAGQGTVSYSHSISSFASCPSCYGTWQSTVINHYSSVPTFYPDEVQPEERGYGSMVVVGPDDGKKYYFWIKSDFFALDVADYYNMQWIGPSVLPVYFDNNILSGSYCLKVTSSRYSPYRDVVWCGTAVVAPYQTTTVRVAFSGCPFGCNCC